LEEPNKENNENIFHTRYTCLRARTHARVLINIFTLVIQSLYRYVFTVIVQYIEVQQRQVVFT